MMTKVTKIVSSDIGELLLYASEKLEVPVSLREWKENIWLLEGVALNGEAIVYFDDEEGIVTTEKTCEGKTLWIWKKWEEI